VIAKLQPNDLVLVYHGTMLSEAPKFIYGFDANTVKSRQYGGPRHAGLFVSPNVELAERFASYGELILEIAVKARYLHGTDYSGNIGRVQRKRTEQSTKEWIRNSAPNSFRPYLSMTLSQGNEPQALLRGLVSPKQILRIQFKPYGQELRWYTRHGFVNAGIIIPKGAGGSYYPKPIKPRGGYDLSYPNYTYRQLIQAISGSVGVDPKSVGPVLARMIEHGRKGTADVFGVELVDFLGDQIGFGETAARDYTAKLISGTMRGQP